jgi:hypothetical protein
MIGISKTRGGTSGTLNMLLRWYFETPRMTVMVVLWGTLGWYFGVPIVGLRDPLWWYFGVRWNRFWWYFEVLNAKIICHFAGILVHEPRVLVVLKYCCFSCFCQQNKENDENRENMGEEDERQGSVNAAS